MPLGGQQLEHLTVAAPGFRVGGLERRGREVPFTAALRLALAVGERGTELRVDGIVDADVVRAAARRLRYPVADLDAVLLAATAAALIALRFPHDAGWIGAALQLPDVFRRCRAFLLPVATCSCATAGSVRQDAVVCTAVTPTA